MHAQGLPGWHFPEQSLCGVADSDPHTCACSDALPAGPRQAVPSLTGWKRLKSLLICSIHFSLPEF